MLPESFTVTPVPLETNIIITDRCHCGMIGALDNLRAMSNFSSLGGLVAATCSILLIHFGDRYFSARPFNHIVDLMCHLHASFQRQATQ